MNASNLFTIEETRNFAIVDDCQNYEIIRGSNAPLKNFYLPVTCMSALVVFLITFCPEALPAIDEGALIWPFIYVDPGVRF